MERWLRLLQFAILAGMPLLAGCTRQFFRERTDADVAALLSEKNKFEPWKIEQFHVYPDPRARFADPTNPDRPPMPPDDPAARYLSPNPQRPPHRGGVALMEGVGYLEILKAWDAENRTEIELLPPPDPAPNQILQVQMKQGTEPAPETLSVANEQPLLLKLEQAVELGLFNSREFQDQRENLYLAALPVSLQRFSFAFQWAALGDIIRQSRGKLAPGGKSENWQVGGDVALSKLFPTGALLLVRLANDFVFEMISGKTTTSLSTMSVDLTQPLLQGGGRAVTLEPLTQSERDLLYQIRAYARFRKEFFVSIAGGGRITGGRFTPRGFEVLTGITSPNAGFLPALLDGVELQLQQQNYAAFARFLDLFEALKEGGEQSQLQVDQIKQRLLRSRTQVLQSENAYRTSLDNFKLQLGLPTDLAIQLEGSPLKPLMDHLNRFQKVLDDYETALIRAESFGSYGDVLKVRDEIRGLFRQAPLVRGTPFRERIDARWGLWEKLPPGGVEKRLAELREQRQRLLDEKTRREVDNLAIPPELLKQLADLESDSFLGTFELQLREYEKQPWLMAGVDDETKRRRQVAQFRIVFSALSNVLVEPRNQRFEILRQTWPTLPAICVEGVDLVGSPLDVAYTRASQTALSNRLDLMNARAQLVDSWRRIAVGANALMGVLDVQYHLDSSSNPAKHGFLDLESLRARNSVTIHGELPLVRRRERNAYRVALINFQRQRRSLQATEDFILRDVRADIRQLRVIAESYRLQQQQVELAYSQVENALDTLRAPQPPQGAGQAGGQNAGSQAALTNQLIQAQDSLVQAQTQLLTQYINYVVQRMTVFVDLELMPLNARGVWIDEHATRECDSGQPTGLPGRPNGSADQRNSGVEPASHQRNDGEIRWNARTRP